LKKIPYILIALFLLTFVFPACQNKTEENEVSSEVELSSIVFASDEDNPGIEDAVFTIDLDSDVAQVYNEDSLPFGTSLDSIVTNFYFTTTIGYAVFYSDSDTVLVSSADTLDFNKRPCLLYVVSEDQTNEQSYEIWVNVHKVDPDLYVWTEMQENLFPGNRDVHAEYFDGKVNLFTQDGIEIHLYRSSDGKTWGGAENPTGLPVGANVRQFVKGKEKLFYTQDNKLYSSADALTWTETDCSSLDFNLLNMLFCYNDSLWAVVSDKSDGKLYFATMAEDGTPAKQMQIGTIDDYCRMAGENFPVSDFAALTFVGKSGRKRAMVMGGYDVGGNSLNSRWNLEWVPTAVSAGGDTIGFYRLENFTIEQPSFAPLTGASVLWYDDRMLLFGSADANSAIGEYPILESYDEGMNWSVPDTAENRLPETYTVRQRQAAAITSDQSIILIGGQSRTASFSDVYRGKKNSIDWEDY